MYIKWSRTSSYIQVRTVNFNNTGHHLSQYQSLRGTSKVQAVHSMLDSTFYTMGGIGIPKCLMHGWDGGFWAKPDVICMPWASEIHQISCIQRYMFTSCMYVVWNTIKKKFVCTLGVWALRCPWPLHWFFWLVNSCSWLGVLGQDWLWVWSLCDWKGADIDLNLYEDKKHNQTTPTFRRRQLWQCRLRFMKFIITRLSSLDYHCSSSNNTRLSLQACHLYVHKILSF